jgi:TolB-like protein/DNA-binding winged helix-turn-helix (wHTH) protein/Tfp pilus assembly protein PilF
MAEPREAPQLFCFGGFELDLRSGELRKQGIKVRLQEQPFQVLSMLLERPGEVVTREELRQRLWPEDTFVDFDHSLNTAVNKLREALSDSADAPRFVETLPRRGYRFIAPVEEIPKVAASGHLSPPGIVVSEKPAPGVVVDVQEMQPKLRSEKRRWVITISVMTTAVLAMLGTGIYQLSRRSRPEATAISGAATRIESLAVLPLENLTGDPAQDYFADGMTDALITNLARIRSLRVISRTSVMQYKNARAPLPEIARKLNVDGIIEGSVQRSGNAVRIRVSLLHGPTDRHLWAAEFERDLSDILTLQAELARATADEIQVKLTPDEQTQLAGGAKVDPEVYELYLKGRHRWNERTRDGLLKSLDFFQEAIRKKPDYAEAHAGLADSYNMLALHDYLPPAEAYPKAKAEATRALEINGKLSDAYAARALTKMWYEWDWAEAEKDFRRALEFNPNSAVAHHRYGLYLSAMGRHEQALSELERARQLDPLSPVINAALGDGYLLSRQYERAIQQYRATLEFAPDYAGAKANLGWALVHLGHYDEAVPVFRDMGERAGLVYALAKAGQTSLAQAKGGGATEESRDLKELLQAFKARKASPYDVATAYVGLGQKDRALQFLEKAYAERSIYLVLLNVDPALDPLRSNPRFRELVRRVGLPLETPKASR